MTCIDGYEDESDEIMDRIFETHPHLKDKWDEEVEDWKDDDAQDEFQEILWEEIYGHQMGLIADTVEMIRINRRKIQRNSRLSIGKRLMILVNV